MTSDTPGVPEVPPSGSTPPPPPIGVSPPPQDDTVQSPALPPPPSDVPTEAYAEPQPPAGKHSTRRKVLLVAGVIVAFLAGLGLGAVAVQGELDDTEAELATVTEERDDLQGRLNDREAQKEADEAAAARAEAERQRAEQQRADAEREAAEKAAAEQAEAERRAAEEAQRQQAEADAAAQRRSTIGPGVYEIGRDKDPGTYRTGGPGLGGMCYWAILSDPNGSDIIENNILQGPGIVSLSAGQYFETSGCQTWTK